MASRPTAVVVGAGIGGIAAAARLARSGFRVTVLEKNGGPGGRCDRIVRDGHRFDVGPTLFLMPRVFAETYAALGERMADHLDLRRVDPTYRIRFDDGTSLALTSDLNALRDSLEAIEPGSFGGLLRYLAQGHTHYHVSLERFVGRNFDGYLDYFSPANLPLLFRLKALVRHHDDVGRFFRDPRLKAAFTFQNMYLGLSPYDAPATYSLLQYTELAEGVWFPMGGLYRVIESLAAIAGGLKVISGCERVSLALLDEGRAWFTISALDQPRAELRQGTRLPVSATAAADDVLAGRPHLTPDLAAEADFPAEAALWQAGFRSRINLPLRVGEQVLGALNLVWPYPQGYSQANLTLLSQIADAVALAVEKNRLFTETRQRADELETLAQVSASLRVAENPAEIMEIVLARSLVVFRASHGAIAVPGLEPDTLVVVQEQGWPMSMRDYVFHLDDSVFGHVFSTGRPYLVQDLIEDPYAHRALKAAWQAAEPLASGLTAISAPLRAGKAVTGLIFIADIAPRVFTEADLRLLTAIAEMAGNALHRAGIMETLEQRVAERTRELREANERLKELDRLKDQFVSNVSHELRTPLTNIKLHLSLLERRGPAVMERCLPILQRETERLRRLIEDLLDLSQVRAQAPSLQREPHSLDALLSEVLALHATRAEAKGISLRHEANPQAQTVLVDRAQILQVFTNLVSNPVAYTPPGGHVTVSTLLAAEAGWVGARFHNDGPVIPPEDIPHLFERFFRGKTGLDSGEPGTGLGLSICKDIVERHGGRVDAESTPERGTAFTVWLPLAEDGAQAERLDA